MEALFPVSRMLPRIATTQMPISISMDIIKMARYPTMSPHNNRTHCTLRSYLTKNKTTPRMMVLKRKKEKIIQ